MHLFAIKSGVLTLVTNENNKSSNLITLFGAVMKSDRTERFINETNDSFIRVVNISELENKVIRLGGKVCIRLLR